MTSHLSTDFFAIGEAFGRVMAERDRARATAVALEQELAEVTRERDEALAELARLRGNVQVLSVVTTGLQWPEGQWPEHQPEAQCPSCVPEDAGPNPALGAQFGPPRQEPAS